MLFAPLALAACRNQASVLNLSGVTMGTTYSVVAVDQSRSLDREDVRIAVETALSDVNAQMSNWDAASDISRFNAARTTDAVSVAPELAELVAASNDIHLATGGQFDLTLGPLIDLWGFGSAGTTGFAPSKGDIEAALALAGQGEHLRAGSGFLQKTNPDTQIIVSGIGKGHGVDRVAKAIASLGLKDYLIEIGGDLYTAGRNADGEPWQIGLESPDPAERRIQQVLEVTGRGMATSGDYRNYFEEDGVRYSHILDARTGRPVTHTTASATVLADNTMLADAWATALLGLGRERGLEIAEANNVAVLFIDRVPGQSDGGFRVTESTQFSALYG